MPHREVTTYPVNEVPGEEILANLARRYPEADPTAIRIALQFLKVSRDMVIALEDFLEPFGLTPSRFRVMMILLRDSATGHSPSELAEVLGVTKATMTGLLSKLERDRLVRRASLDGDRRACRIRLTPKGTSLLNRVLPEHFVRISAMLRGLGRQERDELSQVLSRLLDEIKAVASTPSRARARRGAA